MLSGGTPKSWKVEGIGEDFVPRTFNSQLVDDWVRIGDAESFATARALARAEGILAGGSSGTNVAAALRYARRLQPGQIIVTIICDTGRNYLSKFYDDTWLAANHLTTTSQPVSTAGDLLRQRGSRVLTSIMPEATVAEAIDLMQNAGISQLPVLKEGEAAGSIQEVTLARILHDKEDPARVKVGDVMARPLPQVDGSVHLDEVYRLLLSGNTGVLVTHEGKVLDIITRIDLVQYYKTQRGK